MDRNRYFYIIKITGNTSLSARRAWIEIDVSERESLAEEVALRKESVDRNIASGWPHRCDDVALRKESVDRNYPPAEPFKIGKSRSPQGERG